MIFRLQSFMFIYYFSCLMPIWYKERSCPGNEPGLCWDYSCDTASLVSEDVSLGDTRCCEEGKRSAAERYPGSLDWFCFVVILNK